MDKMEQGDIFKIKLESNDYGYIQFIRKTNFLGSDLIRVYNFTSSGSDIPNKENIINSKIIIYTHTLLSMGMKQGELSKVHNSKIENSFQEPRFRSIQYHINNGEKIPEYLIYCNDDFIEVSKDNKDFSLIPNRAIYQPNHLRKIIELGFDPSSEFI